VDDFRGNTLHIYKDRKCLEILTRYRKISLDFVLSEYNFAFSKLKGQIKQIKRVKK